ncbi:coiled-coil domain-containing protein 93 isoform X1 [Orussus abietinus]|uniref:coiled-coil domain-containing protein 93 isoform X1 n=1 Tax=Orussus abietinus TaxID=222816 RepID=UPI0006267D7F|nr:coiled-coil domain-containing protein 93 isoform X1 [Orussus abietinus]
MFSDVSKRPAKSLDTPEIDVREDEEQAIKFQEIIDLLVAAGYFRARIKGLSNFDKVVGGMTWCIESCSFDVHVDLLFQENLTIGQKIALTEKIVSMLPKMNCPHRIEPHQIQGLDCIHIFPVIQWLVKRSLETREETADFVRSFAIRQYDKSHTLPMIEEGTEKMKDVTTNVKIVKEVYQPRRRYKRKDAPPNEEIARIQSTLLEYGIPSVSLQQLDSPTTATSTNTAVGNIAQPSASIEECTKVEVNVEKLANDLLKNMTIIDDNAGRPSASVVGSIVSMQAKEIAKAAEKYASWNTDVEVSGGSVMSGALAALDKQRTALQNKRNKLKKERDSLMEKVSLLTDKLSKVREDSQTVDEAFQKMKELETDENKIILKELEELLSVHDGLKSQEQAFREHCKAELTRLRNMVASVVGEPEEEESQASEFEERKEAVAQLRLQLAKRNRAIASLTRQLDDVPGRSELTQYQRRFMELYNQVAAKHKETKQYYTLYNTLDDTKLYLNKELSLLNSIQENYTEAMASASGKDQFLQQLEAIVAGVKRNKAKVEKRCIDEKMRRDSLSQQLASLVEQQRKYVAAVRQLTIECRKNEALLAKLRGP